MSADEQKIKKLLHAVLNERDSLDHEVHSDHHQFLELLIEKQKRKDERWEAVRKQVMGWGAIVFLTGVGTAAYRLIMDLIKGVPH